jgi:uncharacterized membrane protein YhaH (DUF805 family)
VRWTQLLFSFKGRIQRLYFWVTSLVVGVVVGMLTSTFQFVAQFYGMGEINPESNDFEPTGPLSIAMFVVALANMWINFALTIKRLHDRDRTGWWLVALYVVIILAIVLGVVTLMQPEGQREPLNTAAVGAVFAASVLMLWLFVEIGFLKGPKARIAMDPIPWPKSTPMQSSRARRAGTNSPA